MFAIQKSTHSVGPNRKSLNQFPNQIAPNYGSSQQVWQLCWLVYVPCHFLWHVTWDVSLINCLVQLPNNLLGEDDRGWSDWAAFSNLSNWPSDFNHHDPNHHSLLYGHQLFGFEHEHPNHMKSQLPHNSATIPHNISNILNNWLILTVFRHAVHKVPWSYCI